MHPHFHRTALIARATFDIQGDTGALYRASLRAAHREFTFNLVLSLIDVGSLARCIFVFPRKFTESHL